MFDMPMYAVVEISAQPVINAMLYRRYKAILFNCCFWMLITCASQPPRIVHFLQDFLKEWPSPKDEDARFAGVLKGSLSHKIQKRSPK